MRSIRISWTLLIAVVLLVANTVFAEENTEEIVEIDSTEEAASEDSTLEPSEDEIEIEEPASLELPATVEEEPEMDTSEEVLPDEPPAKEPAEEEPTEEVEEDTVETVEETEEETSIITVVLPGTITFPSVPISNENIELAGTTGAETEMKIEHSGPEDDWELTVQAKPFYSPDGHKIENALFYEDEIGKQHDIERAPHKVLDASEVNAEGDTTINIGTGGSGSFLLKTNPLFAKSETTYTSTVTWTLTDGP